MADGIDTCDAEYIRHDRVGRAAPALSRDATLLREAHQVPANEEELGQAGLLDDGQLVGQLPDNCRGHRVVAAASAVVAQTLQV